MDKKNSLVLILLTLAEVDKGKGGGKTRIHKRLIICRIFCGNPSLTQKNLKKSHIRETPTLSTNADSRSDKNLKRLRDLSKKNQLKKI